MLRESLLQFCLDEGHHRVTQFHETAVEEMFGSFHDQQFGSRLQTIHPLDGLFDIDEFVFVALHDEERAAGQ